MINVFDFCVTMTQDESRLYQYYQVMIFMEEHHRRPSKYCLEEKLLVLEETRWENNPEKGGSQTETSKLTVYLLYEC